MTGPAVVDPAGGPGATTEAVVVLFTDIVGSTELSMRHSPDGADEVRRAHFSVLRQAVTETGGTEVKNLGDGLMVVFSSASAALACAVAMQRGVELANRRADAPVGLRVGLSGGEATREDDDYFGDPVVEAARLCAACGPGQVLAAEVVRLLAGRRSPHGYRSVGPLDLKGLPDAVETVEITWEPVTEDAPAAGVPLPGRLAVPPDVGVVGRTGELGALAGSFARVTAGGPLEIHLVSGEAGLGKTTLVAEAARRAHAAGACVLVGHAEEDVVAPYQLFAESLRHYVTHAPEDRLRAHVEAHGAELAGLVPALASRLPDLPPSRATDAEAERYLLFAAVVGLLADASVDQPVVLVLDDLQWADKGSLLLLRHLAAADRSMRILVLGTYRDGELAMDHPFLEALAALHRVQGVHRTELPGMDDADVAAIMAAAAGYVLGEAELDLARAVHRETDGNPFFVTEVLRHLAESGVLHQDGAGHWVPEGPWGQVPLPESLREVIGARVARLGPDAATTLSVAAVIGRDFDLPLLAGATGTDEDALLDLLDAAGAASLVRELSDRPGRYSFSHALIQHVLVNDLGATRRARLHRSVAVALEALVGDRPGPRVGELARHWGATGRPGDAATAVRWARLAGDAALAALAPADALRCFTEAAALAAAAGLDDPQAAIDLAIGLGTAQRQAGDPGHRESLLEAARRAADLGDTGRLVAAVLANDRGWASSSGAVDEEKVAMLELAAERLAPDHPDRALVLATLCGELAFGRTLAHRRALADEALAIVGPDGDDVTVVRILTHVVLPLLVPELLAETLAWTADAQARAERVGDPVLRYSAAIYRAIVATRAGDVAEVDRCYALAGPLVHQLHQPALRWEYGFHLAKRAQITGDTDEAERLATEALEIGLECGQPDAATFFGVQLAAVSWERGTMGDLVPILEQMVVDSPGLPTLRAALALAHSQAGDLDASRALLEAFAATGFDLPRDSAWLNGMTEYAEAAATCGDPHLAGPLYDLLVPWADQFSSAGGVTAEGPVANVLGGLATVLGRYDEAEAHLASAAAFGERYGARFYAAQTEVLLGELAVARGADGDADRARDHLGRAAEVAAAHGYVGVARRAAAALAALDGTAGA